MSYGPNTIAKTRFANLAILDSIVPNYRIFFTGENHTYRSENANIALTLQEFLHEKAGVKNLIIEFGYARGYMIDAYINGDSTYLEKLKNTSFNEYIAYYEGLKQLNDSLPKKEKLSVYGVDIERFDEDAFILLDLMVPKEKTAPKEIAFDLEVIAAYAVYCSNHRNRYYPRIKTENTNYFNRNSFHSASTVDSILTAYQAQKNLYQNFIPDSQFIVFNNIMESLIEYRKWQNYNGTPHQGVYRERTIYQNIKNLMDANPSEKFFGQFGRCHTSLNTTGSDCNWYDISPTVKRLDEGVAQGKVLNLAIVYRQSPRYSYNYSSIYNTEIEHFSKMAEVETFLDSNCTDENIILETSKKDSIIHQNFPYILLNNSCEVSDNLYGYRHRNNKHVDFHEWVTTFDLGVGSAQFNLNNINNQLGISPNSFSNQFSQIDLGYSYADIGFYHTARYSHSINQKDSFNNSTFKLGYGSGYLGFGFIPHISKRFAFAPFAALGYSRMKLAISSDSFNFTPANGFNGVNKIIFYNPAITVGGGLDLRFALSPSFGIFARGIYLHDISNKEWRYSEDVSGNLVDGSPKTSMSNYAITIGISIMGQN